MNEEEVVSLINTLITLEQPEPWCFLEFFFNPNSEFPGVSKERLSSMTKAGLPVLEFFTSAGKML